MDSAARSDMVQNDVLSVLLGSSFWGLCRRMVRLFIELLYLSLTPVQVLTSNESKTGWSKCPHLLRLDLKRCRPNALGGCNHDSTSNVPEYRALAQTSDPMAATR